MSKPSEASAKIALKDHLAFKQVMRGDTYNFPNLVEWLKQWFPTDKYSIDVNGSGLIIRILRNYNALSCSFKIEQFPSCCGWGVYHCFQGMEFNETTRIQCGMSSEQMDAFKQAIMLKIHSALIYCRNPELMAVFVSKNSDREFDLGNLIEHEVDYYWALEALTMLKVPMTLLDTRINTNSSRLINTVSFNKPTLEQMHAAWN